MANNRDRLLAANNMDDSEKNKLITKEFKENAEIAIIRKTLHALIHGDPIPDEFEIYHQRVEEIKAEVEARLHPQKEMIEDE